MNKEDLAIIYQSLTQEKAENISKSEYLELLNYYSKDDKEKIIENFREFQFEEYFEDFDNNSLIYLLSSTYRKSFPFSRSVFRNEESLRKTIYWYYRPEKIRLPSIGSLNEKQKEIINNISNWRPRNPVIQIVNAGPGTGKTTTANTLAYSLKDEGVLLISYTNESVRENLHRFHQYPQGKVNSGFKKYVNTNINLATVDSLASKVLGDFSDTDYDQSISRARMNLNPLAFTHPTRTRLYNHVIVDECQDIDDLRGNFILYFCQEIGIKSLSLFGDPRQRIRSNCGKWYRDLWCDEYSFQNNNLNPERFTNLYKIGFDTTYRFSSQIMNNLVNVVSSIRPELHVELKTYHDNDPKYTPIEILTLNTLDTLLETHSDIFNESTVIIGPSITADNQTSNAGRQIASIMKKHGKKIMMKNEGAFVPNAIPFLSIHAAKGREFDNVILFGMSNYPDSFPMIPREEALSLLFVSHSRAKKKIYYLHHKEDMNFTIPLGIPKHMIVTKEVTVRESEGDLDKINKTSMRHYSITQLVKDHSFTKFLESNGYHVHREEDPIKLKNWSFPRKPKNISSELWGFISGFYFQCQLIGYQKMYHQYFKHILEKRYSILPKEKIFSEIMKGNIINGININNGKMVLSKDVDPEDDIIFQNLKETCDWGKILYLHDKYYNEESEDIQSDIELSFEGTNIRSFVKNCPDGETEVSITSEDFETIHGRIDFQDNDKNIYEFKSSSQSAKSYESSLQVWLYHVLTRKECEEALTQIVDIQNGVIYTVNSSENIARWKYILRSYCILRHHIEMVNSRRNYVLSFGKDSEKEKINNAKIPENSFIADTEFGDKEDIFELALVNVKDPYSTLVDLFLPDTLDNMRFALKWLPHCIQRMFTGKMSYFRTKYNIISNKVKEIPTIGYYVCKTDIKWCINKFKGIDLSQNARKVTEKSGFFIAGNFGPKLGELYTHLSLCPLEFQEHLQAHQALCDTLMLYELIVMGELSF